VPQYRTEYMVSPPYAMQRVRIFMARSLRPFLYTRRPSRYGCLKSLPSVRQISDPRSEIASVPLTFALLQARSQAP
jgi:hypothetical protein